MISVLFAALCVAYDIGGACVDRMILPAGKWEGPSASAECEAEAMASRQRLQAEDLERHFIIYCESQAGGE